MTLVKLYNLLFESNSNISEAMQTEPPEGYVVDINLNDSRNIIIKIKPQQEDKSHPNYIGTINLEKSITVDNGTVWQVAAVTADKGYGPLLYDLAMETVLLVGGIGLMPDRIDVSPEARNVWKKYFEERSDVIHKPLPEDLFAGTRLKDRQEYLRYYYYKTSTPVLDKLKSINKLSF
jgi:hypothetical protein